MSTTTTSRSRVRDDYLALIERFPLRELRSERDYGQAVEVLKKLMLRDERSLSTGEADYLSGLGVLVEKYEAEHYPFRADDARAPHERLRFIVEESGLSVTAVAGIIGSSSGVASEVLAGKRQLSKNHIRRLREHFKIRADYFL